MPKTTAENFWSRVDKSGICWIWTGAKVGMGYGKVGFEGKTQRAHRVAWKLTFDTIPNGVCVCHKCDNPPCVNPDHLFLGTYADNNADMRAKGRARCSTHPRPSGDAHYSRTNPEKLARGEQHGCAKLTGDKVRLLRQSYAVGDVSLQQLATELDMSKTAIHRAITGATWKHII